MTKRLPEETMPPTTHYPSAGVGRRLAALVYDGLLLIAISIAYGAAVLAFQVHVLDMVPAPGERARMGFAGFLGWMLVLVGFYCLFWRRFGQTLGMKAWKLVLTNARGERASWGQCLARCLLACVSLAALGLGYFWRWFDPQGLTWHDRLTHTRVQVVKKNFTPPDATGKSPTPDTTESE